MKTEITFINVGYGEAILVRRGPFVMLIDGGSDEPGEYPRPLPRIRCLDYLRDRGIGRIHLMVSTHIHEDHICGLARVARALPVDEYWAAMLPEQPGAPLSLKLAASPGMGKFIRAMNDHQAVMRQLKSGGTRIRLMEVGAEEEVCPGLWARVLGPARDRALEARRHMEEIWRSRDVERIQQLDGQLNNVSLMLALEWEGQRALLPGDTNRAGYAHLADIPQAELFKIGHHGQKDSADEALIRAIAPKYVVFSASSDRRYDSAAPSVVDMVQGAGAQAVLTDPPGGDSQGVTFRMGREGLSAVREYIGRAEANDAGI